MSVLGEADDKVVVEVHEVYPRLVLVFSGEGSDASSSVHVPNLNRTVVAPRYRQVVPQPHGRDQMLVARQNLHVESGFDVHHAKAAVIEPAH